MKLSDFTYDLPKDAIAIHPPDKRGETNLLVLDRKTGNITDAKYKQLDEYLKPTDLIVINNTKVIPARLMANTPNGASRELLLLELHGRQADTHNALVMYRRKIKPGQTLLVGSAPILVQEVYENGTAKISSQLDLWELAEKEGHIPLPPYMNREDTSADRERYQTEFAEIKGSVAAPTASLNMTSALLRRIQDKGVKLATVTLHVGLGTFMPIRVEDVTSHKMHEEYYEIPASTAMLIRKTKESGGRVIAIGTTVTRTLENAAMQILTGNGGMISGEADIFIYPGYHFEIIDGMVTNFHAPHSTVLMMAAAFAGWDKLNHSYDHALNNGYKFLSYGDSMFIS